MWLGLGVVGVVAGQDGFGCAGGMCWHHLSLCLVDGSGVLVENWGCVGCCGWFVAMGQVVSNF